MTYDEAVIAYKKKFKKEPNLASFFTSEDEIVSVIMEAVTTGDDIPEEYQDKGDPFILY